jgi:hypothetical protein
VLYLLDANVLIQAHEDYYPIDRVPQFWDWLLSNAENGLIKMPFEIHGEIATADGPLATWISTEATKKGLLLAKVLSEGYGADLTDNDLEKIGNDAFLIAYALANGERTERNLKADSAEGQSESPRRMRSFQGEMDSGFSTL